MSFSAEISFAKVEASKAGQELSRHKGFIPISSVTYLLGLLRFLGEKISAMKTHALHHFASRTRTLVLSLEEEFA